MSVEIKDKYPGYKGFFKLMVYHLKHELFNGGESAEMKREVFERGNSVAVLLYDPNERSVLLTEQFRLPAHLAGQGAFQMDVPAGVQKEGEDPQDVALREVKEETGVDLEPSKLQHITTFMPSMGGCTEVVTLYAAEVDLSNTEMGYYGVEEEHEDIRTLKLPIVDAINMVHFGRIQNSIGIIALQWLELNDRMV
jgi:ADP-ribose pyrophosphatase